MFFKNIKFKNWQYQQYQLLARIWSNRNAPSLLAGMQNCTATLEDRFSVSYKTAYALLGIQSTDLKTY